MIIRRVERSTTEESCFMLLVATAVGGLELLHLRRDRFGSNRESSRSRRGFRFRLWIAAERSQYAVSPD